MSGPELFTFNKSDVHATRGMVATSQPLAAQAGLDALKAGGNAADAAVTAAAMLNVVEPVSTGIGGDCFALFFDATTKAVTALNGSGRAAAAASIEEVRKLGYVRMPRFTGHAVTVPGALRAWEDLLARHGRFGLAQALGPAAKTAEQGFAVTPIIAAGWAHSVEKLLRTPGWNSGDLDNGPEQPSGNELLLGGRAPRAGETIHLPALARTFQNIIKHGSDWFYRGEFARKACEHVRRYGGRLAPENFSAHTSTWDAPLTCEYRGVTLYECPPNGQGLAAILALNILEGFDIAAAAPAQRLHLAIESMRLAFADALSWVCDPATARIPLGELLDARYTQIRRALIDRTLAMRDAPCGDAAGLSGGTDTVYVAAVDGEGNACSLINSLYMGTGTGLVVPGTGVSLQNRGANFSLDSTHPNALAPRKRPYHTIIPAMTTRDGQLHACFGVMGGFMQPQAHVQMLVNMLDLGMSPQHALDAPRWQLASPPDGVGANDAGGAVHVEPGFPAAMLDDLRKRGHVVKIVEGYNRVLFGGGQIILRDSHTGELTGGSDCRKDGMAAGW